MIYNIFSCCCGRLKNNHQDGALTNQATSDVKWEVSKHTKPDGATNAYGELEFTGAGQASRAKVRKGMSAIYVILNILCILIILKSSSQSSHGFLTSKSVKYQNSRKNPKFHFVKYRKRSGTIQKYC